MPGFVFQSMFPLSTSRRTFAFIDPLKTSLPSRQYVYNVGHMDTNEIIAVFAALSQITRLEVFRLLVRNEPGGLPAGELARLLDVPHNTMSSHLGVLSRSGLIRSQRRGRSIIYRASIARMNDLLGFMVNDCCAGHPELCHPQLSDIIPDSSRKSDAKT
jgi:DNA-binding transcriptional ArsR family regulator